MNECENLANDFKCCFQSASCVLCPYVENRPHCIECNIHTYNMYTNNDVFVYPESVTFVAWWWPWPSKVSSAAATWAQIRPCSRRRRQKFASSTTRSWTVRWSSFSAPSKRTQEKHKQVCLWLSSYACVLLLHCISCEQHNNSCAFYVCVRIGY